MKSLVERLRKHIGFILALCCLALCCMPAAAQPYGYVDFTNCGEISGWAWDGTNNRVAVQIFDGDVLVTEVTAENFRPDLAGAFGDGFSGFSLRTPKEFLNGQSHTVRVRFKVGQVEFVGSGSSLTCSLNGYFDSIDTVHLQGWAWAAQNPTTPVNLDVYDGGTLVQPGVPANIFRQDLLNAGFGNGYHGFDDPTPAVNDNQTHSVSVKYANTTTDLNGSPKNFGGGTVSYQGHFDSLDGTTISG